MPEQVAERSLLSQRHQGCLIDVLGALGPPVSARSCYFEAAVWQYRHHCILKRVNDELVEAAHAPVADKVALTLSRLRRPDHEILVDVVADAKGVEVY